MAGEAEQQIVERLERMAKALERLAGAPPAAPDFSACRAVWHAAGNRLSEVAKVNRVELDLLEGIDQVRDILLENTRRFADGLPANNALLWGARVMKFARQGGPRRCRWRLRPPQADRDPPRKTSRRCPIDGHYPQAAAMEVLVFCDDLSFDAADTSYKSLKAALEGGIEGRPENMIFYATSNRRHLLPRDMIENERSTAINPSEAVQEKCPYRTVSACGSVFITARRRTISQWSMAMSTISESGAAAAIHAAALEWQATRGARSGRVAWQFVQDLAGRKGSG